MRRAVPDDSPSAALLVPCSPQTLSTTANALSAAANNARRRQQSPPIAPSKKAPCSIPPYRAQHSSAPRTRALPGACLGPTSSCLGFLPNPRLASGSCWQAASVVGGLRRRGFSLGPADIHSAVRLSATSYPLRQLSSLLTFRLCFPQLQTLSSRHARALPPPPTHPPGLLPFSGSQTSTSPPPQPPQS